MDTTPGWTDDPTLRQGPPRTFRIRWPLLGVLLGIPFAGTVLVLVLLLRGVVRFDDSSSGWNALWLGDVDGDRVPDLALAVSAEPGSAWGGGRVRILSGASGRTLGEVRGTQANVHLSEVFGPVAAIAGNVRPGLWWQSGHHQLHVSEDDLGAKSERYAVDLGGPPADLGDVDGDGAPELLVSGFPFREDQDTVSALSTRTGKALWTLARPERRRGSDANRFGWNCCTAGDVNGDGATDAAIVNEHSRVLLVDGRSGEVLRELGPKVGPTTGELAPLGDVDGDGRPELALYEGWSTGDLVHVVSCADGSVLRTFEGGGFLWSVFSPGDVDGDGAAELAWLGQEGLVVIRIVDGARLHVVADVYAQPGSADFDRDGFSDLLVARNVVVPRRIDPPADLWRRGRIEILSGRDGSLLRTFDESVLPPRDQ